MTKEKLTLSYSGASTFLTCHKKWWWIYVEDLTPKAEKSRPLQVGDVEHRLLNKYYLGDLKIKDIAQLEKVVHKLYPQNTNEEDLEVATQAAILLNGYVQKFMEDELTVISPEMHLEKDYGDFILYSRLDALCHTPDGRLWRMEHKTASRTDKFYLAGLRKGLQTGIAYWLLEDLVEEKVVGTIFNMLVKTKIPDYPRMPVLRDKWLVERSKRTIQGVYRDIQHGDFYESSQCNLYNHACEFEPLCRNDTPKTRETFYTSYKAMKAKSKK